jgi:fructosamine-3-kinase
VRREQKAQVARALGAEVASARRVGGGDINDAWTLELADGRRVFVKANDAAPPEMFEAEAHGLAWLDEAGALRIPRVLAVAEDFLALELLEPARPVADFDERLGRGLAALHRFGAPRFGLERDNFIGRLPQQNDPCDDWVTFYRGRRLEPQLRMAVEAGLAGSALSRDFDRLYARLPDLVGPPEPPARLHGDLWGGNKHVDERGLPALIDPAAYAGHREVDLAMMQLFGGFGPRVLAAYDEAYPLDEEWRARVPLYQLYFLMAHVNLFGGGYVGSAEAALARLV